MKLGMTFLTVGLLAVGCASKERKSTALESIEQRKAVAETTDRMLTRAQQEFATFSERINEMRREIADNKNVRNKTDLNSLLNDVQHAVQRTRLELRHQQTVNNDEWRRFESRVSRAVEGNNESPQTGE